MSTFVGANNNLVIHICVAATTSYQFFQSATAYLRSNIDLLKENAHFRLAV